MLARDVDVMLGNKIRTKYKSINDMDKIIKSIKCGRKLSAADINGLALPLRLKNSVISWNNGSKRVDVHKLIAALAKIRQKGGTSVQPCHVIGSGSYGTVYLLDNDVCVKIIKNDHGDEIKTNIRNLMQIDNVDIYSSFVNGNEKNKQKLCPELEKEFGNSTKYYVKYCEKGDLLKYIQPKTLNWDLLCLRTNIKHCMDSLDFFSSKKFLHCDIKLDNILIDKTNKWLLHDFDYCTPVVDFEKYTFTAFTPYYISPYLMSVNKGTASNTYLRNYASIHNILTNGSAMNSFTNMMHTGVCVLNNKNIDYMYDFYEQMIDLYYVNINVPIQKQVYGHKHRGIYSHIVDLINKKSQLKHINMLKNDYYAFGVVIFYIYYNIRKNNVDQYADNKLQQYADNELQQLMALCILPFYTTVEFNYNEFKHGEFILYCVSKFTDADLPQHKNPLYEAIYANMFVPHVFGGALSNTQYASSNRNQMLTRNYTRFKLNQIPKKTQDPRKQLLQNINFDGEASYILDKSIVIKNGKYTKIVEDVFKDMYSLKPGI